jgi:TIR domain
VFLSYARYDSSGVDKLDQWLRDRGVRVIRDIDSFTAGSNIKDDIWTSILAADKVVAVYSQQSKTRDWPSFEHQIAGGREAAEESRLSLPLPRRHASQGTRPDIGSLFQPRGKRSSRSGLEILKALSVPQEIPQYDYNEKNRSRSTSIDVGAYCRSVFTATSRR